VSYHFEPRAGLSRARNCGLNHAKSDVLAFTDDDCYVQRDWATGLARVFADGRARVIGGRVELFNKARLPLTIKTDTDRKQLSHATDILGFIHGANMAFSKEVYVKVGGFDVRLGARTRLKAGEDSDYKYRAFHGGFPISYEPSVVVDHDHGRATREEGALIEAGYAVGNGALAAKHFLRGKSDLLKAVYWNTRSDMAQNKHGIIRSMRKQTPILRGAIGYVLGR
jgi:GT2 family glycosyltransferase